MLIFHAFSSAFFFFLFFFYLAFFTFSFLLLLYYLFIFSCTARACRWALLWIRLVRGSVRSIRSTRITRDGMYTQELLPRLQPIRTKEHFRRSTIDNMPMYARTRSWYTNLQVSKRHEIFLTFATHQVF